MNHFIHRTIGYRIGALLLSLFSSISFGKQASMDMPELHISTGLPYLLRANIRTQPYKFIPKFDINYRNALLSTSTRLTALYEFDHPNTKTTFGVGLERGKEGTLTHGGGYPFSWLAPVAEFKRFSQFDCCKRLGWYLSGSLSLEYREYDRTFSNKGFRHRSRDLLSNFVT